MGQGQWKKVDLIGVKNGINTVFGIPDVPDIETLLVIFNTSALKVLTSGIPTIMECVSSGTTITLGLAPNSTDKLWANYDIA